MGDSFLTNWYLGAYGCIITIMLASISSAVWYCGIQLKRLADKK
jgi:hypothetical protein